MSLCGILRAHERVAQKSTACDTLGDTQFSFTFKLFSQPRTSGYGLRVSLSYKNKLLIDCIPLLTLGQSHVGSASNMACAQSTR